MIDNETLEQRKVAFEVARALLQPICEVFPLEAYRITTSSSGPFSTPPGITMTPSEQVINMIITVADWLMDVE